jgi:hypothetical protein
MRLSIQAILYIDSAQKLDRKASAIEMTEFSKYEMTIPEAFKTFGEARNSFNQAANGLFRVLYTFDPDQPYSAHEETFPSHAKYTKQLANWNKSLERFMQANNPRLNSKEARGVAMLKVQHITASIMANASPPNRDDPRPIAEIVSDLKRYVPYN